MGLIKQITNGDSTVTYQFTESKVYDNKRQPGYYLKLTFMEGDADSYNDYTFAPVTTVEELIPHLDFITAYFRLPWNSGRNFKLVRELPNAELFFPADEDEYGEDIWGYDRFADDRARLDSYTIQKVLDDGVSYSMITVHVIM